MKLFDLEKEAKKELAQEDLQMAKEEIKERLREVRSAERVLAKLKAKYIELLNKDLEEIADDY